MRKVYLPTLQTSTPWLGLGLGGGKAGAGSQGLLSRSGAEGQLSWWGTELLLAAVGGAALQRPPGGKCLFNQEIDRKAGPSSSLVGFQEGWGRAWHANNAWCSRSRPSLLLLGALGGSAGAVQGLHSRPASSFAFISSTSGWWCSAGLEAPTLPL